MYIIDKNKNKIPVKIVDNFIVNMENKKDRLFFNCVDCGKEDSKTGLTIKSYSEALEKIPLSNKKIFRCKQCNIKVTNLEKYGVSNLLKLKEIRKSGLPDGVTNVSQLESVKKKKLDKVKNRTDEEKEIIKQKIMDTHVSKYGRHYTSTKEYREKLKNKYGVENNFQREDIKKNIHNTFINKYGAHFSKTDLFKEKSINTNLERYGESHPMKNKDILEKSLMNKMESCGWISWFSTDTYKEKVLKDNFDKLKQILALYDVEFVNEDYFGVRPNDVNKEYLFRCLKCGKEFYDNAHSKIPRCPVCFPKYKSIAEKEIFDFLSKYDEDIESNNRTIINGLELDILLPNKKLAVEYNGLYWHSELSGGKDKAYHINKTMKCREKGIKLIHVFEDEWITKKDIVKSILLSYVGGTNKIYGRKTDIRPVDKKLANSFFEKNHLQGAINARYYFGLYYNNELVSCISLGAPRFSKKHDIEILRYANKLNTSVLGGFSKLLSYIKNNIPFNNMITYSDLRLFEGKVYSHYFSLKSTSSPSYYYLDKNYTTRINRVNFQKHKLKNLIENFNEELTEWENMSLNNYDRIWDCGNNVYELTLD